jgi:ribosomal protein L37AE/L43A
MSLLNGLKGWFGEAVGSLAQWVLLDEREYKMINDLTIENGNGTTQIDHVIISRFGIFVVEDKNIDGWIFGDPNNSLWTIVKWGRNYRIQNPLHQNYRHIRAIVNILRINISQVHSVIVFRGDCRFKTAMPDNVISGGYISYIKRFRNFLFTENQVNAMYDVLQSRALRKCRATKIDHIESLKERYSSNTVCPKCGSNLVLRTAKKGKNCGKQFYGCSRYPTCHYIKRLDDD